MQVHLVYIHGFQGNDTSFQSFPTDLQKHLSTRLPNVQTSLYPTYKSAKPLSFATHNFLEWLSTQPPAAVILLGHSMGGLLAAEAATDSNNDLHSPQRIIGVIAFDTPYLGIHPHVVITGIASLFSHKEDKDGSKTDREVNDRRHVHIVDERITDEWEEFKKNINIPNSRSPLPSSETTTTTTTTHPSPLLDRTINVISAYRNPALERWLRKHADKPFIAAKRWIVEQFQFGSSMFDANGLKARYDKLIAWDGNWVNYWTETIPKDQIDLKGSAESKARNRTSADGLLQPPIRADASLSPTASSESLVSLMSDIDVSNAEPDVTGDTDKAADAEQHKTEKARSKDKKSKTSRKRRHFVVRPDSLGIGGGEKWELVTIAGVKDEVAAHCGLFVPGQNLDYDGLIVKVGQRVVDWCKGL